MSDYRVCVYVQNYMYVNNCSRSKKQELNRRIPVFTHGSVEESRGLGTAAAGVADQAKK